MLCRIHKIKEDKDQGRKRRGQSKVTSIQLNGENTSDLWSSTLGRLWR